MPKPSDRPPLALLNPRHTFENYVVGATNESAHAAALAVVQACDRPARNPLFIHGGTGLGKTHLLHAIGHAILRANPNAKIVCLTTGEFTAEYVQALRENTIPALRQRYGHVDVFLLDDVQFLNHEKGIQEEFFHIFNALLVSNRQLVFTSDRRASELKELDHRLISRLECAPSAAIDAPDYKTRLTILCGKISQLKSNLPGDVVEFIAQNVSKNIRTLESALLKIVSTAFLEKTNPVNLAFAKKLLRPYIDRAHKQTTTEGNAAKRRKKHKNNP
jgi:chromosomal replication initiator protein